MIKPRATHTRSDTNSTGRRDPAAVLTASTFGAGILLLPPKLQADSRRLYLLLRTIDDLVDENDPRAPERVDAIRRWASGQPEDSPETQTLTQLEQRYPMPRTAISDFCDGMHHDIEHSPIETEHDLDIYCHRVGGTVGIMLAALLGTTHPDGIDKMERLGSAMQRTNILRDIDEDYANGRTYIAQSTINRFGLPAPGKREALLRDQIARADSTYEEGMGAIPLLRSGNHAMGLSTILYKEVLRQIERDGYGRNPGRSTLPAWRKQFLIANYLPDPETRPETTAR